MKDLVIEYLEDRIKYLKGDTYVEYDERVDELETLLDKLTTLKL